MTLAVRRRVNRCFAVSSDQTPTSLKSKRLTTMTAELLLVLVVALAWYDVGTIWAHEVDIFRSWLLVSPESFRTVDAIKAFVDQAREPSSAG